MDVKIKSQNGKLPLIIQGPLQPKNIEIDGSLSSQFLTGLLMAYAAADAKDVSIKVNNLKSKPYIDLTLDVMRRFGLKVPENKNYKEFISHNETHDSSLITHEYTVEGDWSGGAFLLLQARSQVLLLLEVWILYQHRLIKNYGCIDECKCRICH